MDAQVRRRWIQRVALAISLLLCTALAVALLDGITYAISGHWLPQTHFVDYGVCSLAGLLVVRHFRNPNASPD
jgi:hypothetical protein